MRIEDDEVKVILRKGKDHYVSVLTETSLALTKNIKQAAVFSFSEAARLAGKWPLQKLQIVEASVKEQPYDTALMFVDGMRAGFYVVKTTEKKLSLSEYSAQAYRYRNERAALSAMKTIQNGFSHLGTLAPVYLGELSADE